MDSKSCSQIESDRMVEISKNQLYFAVIRGLSGKKIKSTIDALYFSIDDEFEYQNYYYDFGPYNISYLYKYCTKLNKYLQYAQGQKRVVHCTSTNAEKKVNAAYLIGGFCIIYLKMHPAEVTKLLMKAGPYNFSNAGIAHFDLIYPDGSTPSKDILLKFFQIAETAPAAIAVHCKAGLGRTGSLIGAYIIKHYKMTAKEAIAWMRICRPGSVIGQQQMWLEKLESWLWKCGTQYRCKHYGDGDKIPRHKFGIYSKIWPVERGKILREARRRYANQYSASDPEHLAQSNKKFGSTRNKPPYHRFKTKNIKENSCFDDISDFLTSVYGLEKEKNKEHNRTMPNIRLLAAAEPRRQRILPKKIEGGSSRRRAAGEMMCVPSISGQFSSSQTADNESQGDNEYNERNDKYLTSKDDVRPTVIQIPAKSRIPFKVDTDTGTTDYVHSYIEDKARKKALSSRTIKITQGDRLLERKVYKSGRIIRTRKGSDRNFASEDGLSNEDVITRAEDFNPNNFIFHNKHH
ncbi:hypothetical protein HHI36_002367 [Cryptolaemus montrouzieri]|uniref:protein-tyrosine-phosphatase n=1 Tax=Cryptolaemus montrouzieri TaxID=559131 RepID=A0ABD2PAD9_9CUCU